MIINNVNTELIDMYVTIAKLSRQCHTMTRTCQGAVNTKAWNKTSKINYGVTCFYHLCVCSVSCATAVTETSPSADGAGKRSTDGQHIVK